jgi:hypothetical protein
MLNISPITKFDEWGVYLQLMGIINQLTTGGYHLAETMVKSMGFAPGTIHGGHVSYSAGIRNHGPPSGKFILQL